MGLRRTNTTRANSRSGGYTQVQFISDSGDTTYLLLAGMAPNPMVELFENEGLMQYVHNRLLQVLDELPALPHEIRAKENVLRYLMDDVVELIGNNSPYAKDLAIVVKFIGVWWKGFKDEPYIND